MEKFVDDFTVLENRRVNREYYVLELEAPRPLPPLQPGHFAEIRVDHDPNVFLRRPISFYDVRLERNSVLLLIQEVGSGTRRLAMAAPGDRINMIYPLGNTFSMPSGTSSLLIGGGVGVAPLLFLGSYLRQKGFEPEFLLGFRSHELLVDLAEFERFGPVYLTTDDGSAGKKGTVMDHPILQTTALPYRNIYTCGPVVMMKAVAAWAKKHDMTCEASLENTMACGFGVCLCCNQKTIHGNLRVCMEGPVFNTNELIW
jgi:dihydroorotate dehydrogenase electron transfer subunit